MVRVLGGAFLAPLLVPAAAGASPRLAVDPSQARPPAAAEAAVLDLGEGAYALIPSRIVAARPAPLLVLMHGGGGAPGSLLRRLAKEAQAEGIVLLGLKSRGPTWDAIQARLPRTGRATRIEGSAAAFTADPPRIDAAIRALLARVPVDPARIGLAGFSDGASYALSIGIANPQLFSSVLAFSPGMAELQGRSSAGPRVFLSHGTSDAALSFSYTSREILPQLRARGLRVVFRPFDGGHTIPGPVGAEAIAFFLAHPGGE